MNLFETPIHEPITIFAIVLVSALLAPIISERFKMPGIVGLIIVGILIGPSGAGLLERDRSIELLGTIGLIYIMFLSGLEIELEQFKKNQKRSLVFGLLTFSIPLLLGTIAGNLVIGLNLPASILLASMFSSHTLLTFPIISQLGVTKRNSVVTTVGGTIITDVLALLILAVLTGNGGKGVNFLFWGKLFLLSLLLFLFLWYLVPKIGRWFFRKIGNDGNTEYLFVISILFISAVFSQIAGLEGIIGAFLAGLSFSRLVPEKSILMNRIKFIGNSLFIPFFLISVGMLVNPLLLFQGGKVLFVSVVMVVIAIVSKYLAAKITVAIYHYEKWDERLIFGLSVNQAAATLAAVLVGYRLSIFDDSIITGTIIMILVTSIVGAWSSGRGAREAAFQENSNAGLDNTVGAPQRIMIPVSNSQTTEELVNLSFLIREKSSGEPVYPISIVSNFDNLEEQIAQAEKLLAPIVVQAVSAGVPAVPVTRAELNIVAGLTKAIQDLRISELILGWTESYSIFNTIFGELSSKIISQTKQMILVCRLEVPLNLINRILLILPPLIERHPGFEKLLSTIAAIAGQISAKLVILYSGKECFDRVTSIFSKRKINIGMLAQENTQEWKNVLLECNRMDIKRNSDLIVFGNTRTGEIGWQPANGKLLRKMAMDFRENDFIAVYSSSEVRSSEKDNILFSILSCLDKRYSNFDIKEDDFSQAIGNVFQKMFSKSSAKILTAEFQRIGIEEPVELCEGIVLLHAHLEEVEKATIFLLVNRKGFNLPSVRKIPICLFVLLAPQGQSSEEHLERLGAIARFVQMKNFMDALISSYTYEDFVAQFEY